MTENTANDKITVKRHAKFKNYKAGYEMGLVNYHTHTTFCDGANTPEEIVLEALDKGLTALGFSEHSHISFDPDSSMSEESTEEYIKTVRALAEKYRDKIKIFCGIEKDYYSDTPTRRFDYVIGSVHYVEKNGEYLVVDWKSEILEDGINRLFGGDALSLCERYFETVGDVVRKTDCDIIGHFDLVTKFNERKRLIDEDDPRYIRAYKNALDRLIPEDRLFEINTGPIARGYKKNPYPSRAILCEIAKRGGRVIISSDSHKKETLDSDFDAARSLCAECGIKTVEEYFVK